MGKLTGHRQMLICQGGQEINRGGDRCIFMQVDHVLMVGCGKAAS